VQRELSDAEIGTSCFPRRGRAFTRGPGFGYDNPMAQNSRDDRKIREKYGGKLPKAINRAIRAEIPGGNEALDKLTLLAGAARHSGWKDKAGKDTPEAFAYFKHQREVIDKMIAQTRQRWGLPSEHDKTQRRRPPQQKRRAS
jgi:hypothetical protein